MNTNTNVNTNANVKVSVKIKMETNVDTKIDNTKTHPDTQNINNHYPRDDQGKYVTHIQGLLYYRDFLSQAEQQELLSTIDQHTWQEGIIARRQQFYGDIYYHTNFNSTVLQPPSSTTTHSTSQSQSKKSQATSTSKSVPSQEESTSHLKQQEPHSDIYERQVRRGRVEGVTNNNSNTESGNDAIVGCTNEEPGVCDRDRDRDRCVAATPQSNNNNENMVVGAGAIADSSQEDGREGTTGISIQESGMEQLVLDKLMPYFEKEGLFEKPTQLLINEYRNTMGIASHFEDTKAFGPMICTLSLISPTYLTLKRPIQTKTSNDDDGDGHTNNNKNNGNSSSRSRSSVYCDTYSDIVKILVEPGSLLIMRSDARYLYRHGIGKFKWVHLPPPSEEEEETNNNSLVDPDAVSSPTSSSPLVPAADVKPNVLEESKNTTNNDTTISTTTSSNNITTTNNNRISIKRDASYRRVSVTVRHLLSTRRLVTNEEEDESQTIKDPTVY